MSNEKLGAEQGREFDFEAIGEAIDRVLAGQRELTPAEQKNLRGIYSKLFTKLKPEQAYHARGAGLESIDGENQTHGMVVRNLTMLVRRLIHRIRSKYKAPDDVVAKQAWDYLMGEGLQGSVLREPGADAGTTPRDNHTWNEALNAASLACFHAQDHCDKPNVACHMIDRQAIHKLKREGAAAERGTTPQGGGRSPNDTSPMYSDDVIAAIRQQKQSTAAERGTTPPEGLSDERWDRIHRIIEAVLIEAKPMGAMYGDPIWYQCRECGSWEKKHTAECESGKLLAATQRAPVEQGSLKLNYVPRWNSQIVAAEVLSEIRGLDVVTCQNEMALHDAIAKVIKRATETAAPDHAREGATMKCPKCGIDVFAHGETCPVSREGALREALEEIVAVASGERQVAIDDTEGMEWIDKRARRALADGKEGGE